MDDLVYGKKEKPKKVALGTDKVEEGIYFSFKNARMLQLEAENYKKKGNYHLASTFSILAREELAKAFMLLWQWIGSITTGKKMSKKDISKSWQQFWRRFHSHSAKLHLLDILFYSKKPAGKKIRQLVFKADDPKFPHIQLGSKLAGLYVDYAEGRFVLPRDVFRGNKGKRLSIAQVKMSSNEIKNCEKIFGRRANIRKMLKDAEKSVAEGKNPKNVFQSAGE